MGGPGRCGVECESEGNAGGKGAHVGWGGAEVRPNAGDGRVSVVASSQMAGGV